MPLLKNTEYLFENKNLVIFMMNSKTRNAFSLEMAEEIMELILKYKPQGIILSHKGSIFCSGGNLSFYKSLPDKQSGLDANDKIRDLLSQLAKYPCPKVCYVNGSCFGGGIELVSCFDRVIASPRALFGMWQRRVGLSFGWGGGGRLKQRMGQKSLQNWLYSAQNKTAYDSMDCGLVDEIVLSKNAIKECVHWVKKVYALGDESFEVCQSVLEAEVAAFEKLWLGKKHQDALKDF